MFDKSYDNLDIVNITKYIYCEIQNVTVCHLAKNISKYVMLCNKTTYQITRNTFCGTWYLPHSHVHN